MAILNATPDSFSGDGVYAPENRRPVNAAVARAQKAVGEGADLVDIGGMPAFAGAQVIPWQEERERVEPIVRAVAAEVSVCISVDTLEAGVADACLAAGAQVVNSAWGLHNRNGTWNRELARVAAAHGAVLVLTHNRAAQARTGPNGPYYHADYHHVVQEVLDDLTIQLEIAQEEGVPKERLIVDYGPGMGKGPRDSLLLMQHLHRLNDLKTPWLLAHSRKNFIGEVVGGTPAERDGATLALTALGISAGADMIRVHNVALNKQAAAMADAVTRLPMAFRA
jgi:dihydropteroate synthase